MSYWAEKLLTDTKLPPLTLDEANNFGGSFTKWWRLVQHKNKQILTSTFVAFSKSCHGVNFSVDYFNAKMLADVIYLVKV